MVTTDLDIGSFYVFAYTLMHHNIMIHYFHLLYLHVSNDALFLHSSLVLSLNVDAVLIFSIDK